MFVSYLVHAAAGHVYISQIYGWEALKTIRKSARRLIFQIKSALTDIFLQQKWMDWETKRRLIHEIERLNIDIGYPDWITNETGIEYCRRTSNYSAGKHPLDCARPVLSTDSFFEPKQFTLFLPFGMLLPPLFNPDYPATLKFGILGQKIAEGIVRVLLKNRRLHYNSPSCFNTSNTSLMDKMHRVDLIFKLLMRNFPEGYIMPENRFHHGLAQWNFASFLGVRAALLAYRRHALSKGIDEVLPKLAHVTDEQMVLAAFGRSQCSYISETAMGRYRNPSKTEIYFLERTPPPIRVEAIALLLKEFSSMFRCPKESLHGGILQNGIFD